MLKPAVEIRNLSKMFKIYSRPSDRLRELFGLGKRHREFWALRDINLKIERGESVGIVGMNGSGKSTLLQIIAGVMKPTRGEVRVRGKVAALLELGIGFHPELTGRENIRLAASLMGIGLDKETEEKVIEFAEIGEFIDAPVKTYSSGMFVRLAFSLAVCVDPDILIVDEALSVGDIYFQKKSFDRIQEFKKAGKTMIFCSHSMYQVRHLCNRAVWLEGGKVRMEGDADTVTREYESWISSMQKGEGGSRELGIELRESSSITAFTGEDFSVDIEASFHDRPYHVGVGILRNDNTFIYGTSTQIDGLPPLKPGERVRFVLESLPLMPGEYKLGIFLLDDTGSLPAKEELKTLKVVWNTPTEEVGFVRLQHRWEKL